MIQAPSTQYIPVQQPIQNIPQQTGAYNNVQPQQANPGSIYNYPTTSYFSTPYSNGKSQYNGVNIEIVNPQGQGFSPLSGQAPVAQQPFTVPAQFYPLPQAPQPAPQPVNIPAPQIPSPQVQEYDNTQQPSVQQPTVQQPEVQQPEVQQPAAQQPTNPVVDQPAVPDDTKTPESFAGKLKTDDLEAQKNTIEEIANIVKSDDNLAPVLLDTQIFDSLVDIVNKDTSALQGPSPEVIELRNKPQNELTAEEKTKAETPSPLEEAERNKQYALYTISYMQNRLNNELEKRNGKALELKDLPCINTVVETAKSNQNPMLRISALASLSYIARPEYSNDLKTIFELAKSDEDANVQEAANKALNNLDKNAPAENKAA